MSPIDLTIIGGFPRSHEEDAVHTGPLRRHGIVVGITVVAGALALSACNAKTTTPGKKSALDTIKKNGKLVIATDASYAPNEFKQNGQIVGFDIDLGGAIAKKLGVTADFQDVKFDNILPALQSKKYDISLSSFTDNKEREKVVDFVNYYKAGTSIGVRKGNPLGIKTQLDLCGKKVAAEQGTVQLQSLQQDKDEDGNPTLRGQCKAAGKPVPVPVSQPDQNAVNLSLTSGRADAFTADSPVVEYQAKVTGGGVEQGGPTTDVAPYGMALKKNDGTFAQAVQGAIQWLVDTGNYTKIVETWGVKDGAISTITVNAAGSS
jgi:polar amino acid transport system substrate-binding protein